MYFSDVYCDRQVTEEARKNEMLWGECISGALQWEELIEIASETGFSPPMLVEVSPIGVGNAELERLLDMFVMHGVCVVWCVCGAWCVWGAVWYVWLVCVGCLFYVYCAAIVSYKCLLQQCMCHVQM